MTTHNSFPLMDRRGICCQPIFAIIRKTNIYVSTLLIDESIIGSNPDFRVGPIIIIMVMNIHGSIIVTKQLWRYCSEVG